MSTDVRSCKSPEYRQRLASVLYRTHGFTLICSWLSGCCWFKQPTRARHFTLGFRYTLPGLPIFHFVPRKEVRL